MLAGDGDLNRTRSALYSLARFLGDYQAIKNDRLAVRTQKVV